MSNLILTQAWTAQCSPTEKLVLISLADQANEQAMCWPSISSIEKRTNLSGRAIQKALASLLQQGHLTVHFRTGKSSYYTVHPRTTFTPESDSPLNDVHPTPEPRSGDPRTTFTHNHKEPSNKPKTNVRKDYSETFEKFWQKYPRTEGKKKSFEIWQQLKLDSMLDEILVALEWSIKNKGWDRDATYCPHGERWLKNRRWEDMPKQPKLSDELFPIMRDGQKVMVPHAEYVEFKNRTMRIDG